MRDKPKKAVILTAVLLILISGLSAALVVFWDSLNAPKTSASSPHYLTFQGVASRVYLVSATSSYAFANQTYTSGDGREVAEGSQLFVVTVTLRNDYSSENPPPSLGTPVAPIDGTAYICLKATLISNDATVPSINVSPSDFLPSSTDETGLVFASGQTRTLELILATNVTKITDFIVNLVSVSDSIPR